MLLNIMLAKQGMLEQEFPRGHLHLFEGQKRHRSLRSELLKLKEGKEVRNGYTMKNSGEGVE
jgi:hypothetical protein